MEKPSRGLHLVDVSRPYEPKGDNELSLGIGDVVEIECESPDGWCYGRVLGQDTKKGFFPGKNVVTRF